MICLSCGNKFLQPFVCTRCLYNVRSAEAARPQMEVLENENGALQAMLEKCNSKFIVGLEVENAALQKDADRYRHIAKLIGSIFVHGNFKAETHNERELEKCLREVGCFYETLEQFDATIDAAIAKEGK